MPQSSNSMRQRILNTACTLFAKHGYASISLQMIADAVHVRRGTIAYHFKSKKKLYTEVLQALLVTEPVLTYERLQEQEPIDLKSATQKAYAIQRIIADFFRRHLEESVRWKRQIVLREILMNPTVSIGLVDEIFNREAEKLTVFYSLLNPAGTEVDAYLWSRLPEVNLMNYMIRESALKSGRTPEFIRELEQKLARLTARSMILDLDLPVPEALK